MRPRTVAACRFAVALAVLAPCAACAQAPLAAPAAKSATTRSRATTRTLAATVLTVDPAAGTVHLALTDGSAAAARISDRSRFVKKSKEVRPQDFKPNEKVMARLSFRAGGEVWLQDLRDAESHEAYTRDRRETCTGMVAANTGNRLDVRRADGSVLVFRVTDKTLVRKGGALSALSAYPAGAAVAVKPRSLPSGDVMASIVAETGAEVAAAHLDGLVNWEGVVESVDAEKGHLALRRDDGVRRAFVVAPTARLRRGRSTVALKDLTPGAAVKVHLLRGADANGLRTADALSVVVPKEPKKKEAEK
jgi:hypothetical protein